MNLRRTLAVARKESIHIQRDPVSLGIALAMPMVLVLLLGYALNLDLKNVGLTVMDRSQTAESRQLIDAFKGSPYFELVSACQSYDQVEDQLIKGKALVGLIVPADYAEKLRSGQTAAVQAVIDGSEGTTALYTKTYVKAVLLQEGVTLLAKRTGRIPTEVNTHIWYNPTNESPWILVPGVLTIVILIVTSLLCSTTIAKEWENGTMEQLLSTPIRRTELLYGKALPYLGIGMIDVVFSVAAGWLLFRVPLRGSVTLLMIASFIFLMGSLFFGMAASIIYKTQILASQAAIVAGFIPTVLMSGMVVTIENLPSVLKGISYAVNGRYFIAILRSIYLKGVGFSTLKWDIGFMSIYALLMIAIAMRAMTMKLE